MCTVVVAVYIINTYFSDILRSECRTNTPIIIHCTTRRHVLLLLYYCYVGTRVCVYVFIAAGFPVMLMPGGGLFRIFELQATSVTVLQWRIQDLNFFFFL